jgi:hypothetical protein
MHKNSIPFVGVLLSSLNILLFDCTKVFTLLTHQRDNSKKQDKTSLKIQSSITLKK